MGLRRVGLELVKEFMMMDPRVSCGETGVEVEGIVIALRYGVPICAVMRSPVVVGS